MMNLQKLFETQKVLRDRIAYNEPDRFDKIILALLVELGECANEWRGFKFWSKNQEPRTKVIETNIFTDVYGKPLHEEQQVTGENPLLEEYVDGLHFVLEIGLELNVTTSYENILPIVDERLNNVTIMFHQIYACASNLFWSNHYQGPIVFDYIELFQCYLKLGEMLGFTWEQIEQAYFEKNSENHRRQDNGY